MRRYRIFTLAILAPAALVLALGCGKKKDGGNVDQGGTPSKPAAQATGPGPGGAKTPIEAKEWTTLKGKVVLDGEAPKDDGSLKKQMEDHKDKDVCAAAGADTAAFTWRVNPENKGVANVVVWVKPPDGKYFKPGTPNEEVWKRKDAAVDQPNCAFEPHVQAAFLSYFDGKDNKPSGQKVKVLNSAPVDHNTKWSGDQLRNPGDNPTIRSKGEYDMTPKLKADAPTPITLSCNIHQWMKGYLWALDTPYFAITDKDGNFEIKDLPADTDVMVVKWHEGLASPGFLDGGTAGTKVALKPGTTDLGEIKLNQSIGNIVQVTYHDLRSSIGPKEYNAIQKTVYYQSIFQSIIGTTNHQYKAGIGYQYDILNDAYNKVSSVNERHIPGAFAEYTYSFLEKFKLVTGFRTDYQNTYGWIFTPRMHGKFNFTDDLVLRWSGGRSFRTPYAIADNISVLANSKQLSFDEKILPEEAWNYGLNLSQRYTLASHEGTLSVDFYRTDFLNQLIVDQYTDAAVIHFYNLDGKSNATSFQVMVNQELWEQLNIRLAYKRDDVQATYSGIEEEKPLVARDRALLNLGLETKNRHWRFDYTLVWEGKKRLVNNITDDRYGRLPDYSPTFFVMHAQVTKVFKRFELYGGGENLLDFHQEHPIINANRPFSNEFDATQVWGPVEGRRIYIGLRISIS